MMQLLQILRQLPLDTFFGVDVYHSNRADSIAALAASGIRMIDQGIGHSVSSHLRQHGHQYDLILLSRAHVASKYIDEVRQFAPRSKIIFDTTDLSFMRGIRGAKVTGNAGLLRQALAARRDELSTARKSDITLTVSTAEQEILEGECPGIASHVVSLIHEARASAPPFSGREDILFVGAASHLPNLDGILHFCQEVRPILARTLPGVKTRIVGTNPPDSISSYASEDCLVMGHIPDLIPWMDHSKLSIAPLRFGAGVKGKVLMSMAHGLPVVASSIAAEGIPALDGRDILIADGPDAFGRKIAHLYHDEALWSHLSANGMKLVGQHFSLAVARDAIREVLRRLDVGI
jgi:glycosyltransferase involved in cell wall biosynthesis